MGRTDKELKEHELSIDGPLLLLESGDDGATGVFNEDGSFNVCVIRPGQSIGRSRKVYTADMLERESGTFKGWPMFENHESPAVRRARGHIPRSPADLRGELVESRWDPDFTTPDDEALGFDKGAVVGRAMPTKPLRDLLETIPRALKLSIKAYATSFRDGIYHGRKAELVEGFDKETPGSVDVVTKAGAGGHVLALQESGYDREHGDAERALEDLGDDDLVHHVSQHRPHLLPLIESAVDDSPADLDDDERAVEESEMGEVDTKALEEAAAKGAQTALTAFVGGDDFKSAVKAVVTPLVESEVAASTDETRELLESGMVPRRQVELRDLRTIAHDKIKASKLPEPFIEDLLLRYGLEESADGELHPRPALDVTAEMDGEKVTKTARKALEESLDEDIERERVKLAAARPTRVSGLGASTAGDGEGRKRQRAVEESGEDGDGEDGDGGNGSAPRPRESGWRAGLRAAGVDPAKLAKMNRESVR